tara:strand:+ start:550 stop:1050 length:501 start_codon:yes stop_codon:yes gene_type:complete
MIGVEITKNFLDKNFFQDLQKLITKSEFAWFQRKTMVRGTTNNLGYFTHSFYNNNRINCDTYFKYIIPILEKLNSKAVIEVRANLTPSVFFKDKNCDFHTDNSFNCKTAILYLNTCDGGTEFKIDNKTKFIKSEENKIVIFDSNIEHRATTSHNADFRYILNFNYF